MAVRATDSPVTQAEQLADLVDEIAVFDLPVPDTLLLSGSAGVTGQFQHDSVEEVDAWAAVMDVPARVVGRVYDEDVQPWRVYEARAPWLGGELRIWTSVPAAAPSIQPPVTAPIAA